jgi:outer membrane protein assembly factor BamB
MGISVPFQLPIRHLFSATLMAAIAVSGQLTFAQGFQGTGMITQIEAQRGGLQRKWFTQLEVNPSRGGLTSIRLFSSEADVERVFVVKHGEDRFYFSERDRDNVGRLLGEEGARKLANGKIEVLEGIKPLAVLEERLIPATTIYAVSSRGVVHAVNGETGKTLWTQEVGKADYPTTAVAANDSYVAVVNGSTLYVLTATKGEYVWDRKLKGAVGAAPAITKEHVFVPLITGTVEIFDLEDDRQPTRSYVSAGRALLQPIVTEASVIWPTDRGYLYVGRSEKMGLRYRLEAKGTIAAKATVRAPDFVYCAAVDGFVYCVNELSGDILWRFSTGEPITHMPICVGDDLYVVTVDGSFFKLNSETGEEYWYRKGIEKFISASKDHVYCVDKLGRLVKLRAATGSRTATLNTKPEVVYPNQTSDRLYVATENGLLQCLCENENRLPVFHTGIGAPGDDNDRPEVEVGGGPMDPMNPQDPMNGGNPFDNPPKGDNPFDPGGDDNPFGPPKDTDDGDDDNPFGGGDDDDNPFGGGANPFG